MEDSLKLEFRKATAADLEAVYQVYTGAIAKMDNSGIPQWDEMYPDREILSEDISKNQLTVGTADGKIVCVYVINLECEEEYRSGAWQYPDASFRVVHRLCVSAELQNRGVGRAVAMHIWDELKTEGVETIRLDAFTLNPSALKLYEDLGCVRVGYADWRKGRFVLMEKKL